MKGILHTLPDPSSNKSGWPWTVETNPGIYNNSFSWPKISIITPSFNQGEYIEETIRSVILQNYPNLEYVIIDGGSNDNTINIIKKYDKWINFWVSEKDNGQADAINKGLNYLSGDLFNWINSDDLLSPDSLYHIAINYENNDIVAGNVCIFSDKNSWIDTNKNLIRFADIGIGNIGYLQPACWIRLNDLHTKGKIRSDLHYSFDYEMMLRLVNKNSRIKYVNHVTANFRLHEGSKTVSQTINFFIEKNKIYCEKVKSAFEKNDHEGITKALIALTNESLQQYLSYSSRISIESKKTGNIGMKPLWQAFIQTTSLYLRKLRFIVSGFLRISLSIVSNRIRP